jgi:hypothetical protein
MRRTRLRRFALWALAAAWVGAMTSVATAGSFTRECAARDLQVLMMIEQQEDANTVTPDKVNDAMLTMLHARIVCHEGHVLDALAIYNRIAQSITPESHALNRGLGH